MIYNDILKDREKEKQDFYLELQMRKQAGLAELKKKLLNTKNSLQKSDEIQTIKMNISKQIKNKIINSMIPREKKYKNSNLSSSNNEAKPCQINNSEDFNKISDDNASDCEEIKDAVKENDIELNQLLKKCEIKKLNIKSANAQKRVSHGYIGSEKLSENNKINE